MQITSAASLSAAASSTANFRILVPQVGNSLSIARSMVENHASLNGATLGAWTVSPGVFESLPPQRAVSGTFTGSQAAVDSAMAGVSELQQQIRNAFF